MEKIVYFTAGAVPTSGELADIAKLNAAAEAPYVVLVSSAKGDTKYGEHLIDADYVAGTPPTAYSAVPTIDPDNMPILGLPDTSGVVTDGQTFAVTGGTVTMHVADNVVTATFAATP